MSSAYSQQALDRLREQREAIGEVLARYGASNPRLFGPMAASIVKRVLMC